MTIKLDCTPMVESINHLTMDMLKECKHTPQLAIKIDDTISDPDEMYLRGIIKDAIQLGIHVGGSYDTADGILYLGKSWSKYDQLEKDVDGAAKNKYPSVVRAVSMVIHCIRESSSYQGESALIIGRGPVGIKIAKYLLAEDMTVTIAHSMTPQNELSLYYSQADLIINAGATNLSLDSQDKPKLIIDISGGDNTYHEIHGILLANRIGTLTRAILLNSLAYRCKNEMEA